MALVSCPECNTTVSNKARACPSCGAQISKPKRGFFGTAFKWLFILFNAFMAFAMWNGMKATSDIDLSTASDAEMTGHAIGAGLGFTMILLIWALGAVILGLLTIITRPR